MARRPPDGHPAGHLDRIRYLMSRTQEERKADTRARLLAAAAELFADHGIDAVSVDAVAEAAGPDLGGGLRPLRFEAGPAPGPARRVGAVPRHRHRGRVRAGHRRRADRLRAVAANVVTNPSEETRRLLLLERELWLRASADPEVARPCGLGPPRPTTGMARGFAAWIGRGHHRRRAAAPDTLATVFRALVVGLEIQHRIDPDGLDIATVATALGHRSPVSRSPVPPSRPRPDTSAFPRDPDPRRSPEP